MGEGPEAVKRDFEVSVNEMFSSFREMISNLDKSDGSIELMHSKILKTESFIFGIQAKVEKVRAETYRYAYLVEERSAINKYFQNGSDL